MDGNYGVTDAARKRLADATEGMALEEIADFDEAADAFYDALAAHKTVLAEWLRRVADTIDA